MLTSRLCGQGAPIKTMTTRAALLAFLGVACHTAHGQLETSLQYDMVLDANALLMPQSATYGRAINGVSFQTQPLLTANGYQYATWYHLGSSDEDVYLARRDLTGTTWEVLDTGLNFDNGDGSWDAHNVISMGVSGDGSIHLSWDHHTNTLRYADTDAGVTTNPAAATWDSGILNAERSSLNLGGSSVYSVTYPRFITAPSGDLLMSYRTGGSGNGQMNIATYNDTTGLWNTPHEIIASTGTYTDALGSSTSRNAYMNGFSYDANGTIHMTWTWRESAGGANHGINYAYSDDGGSTWRNNDGTVIGTPGNPISIYSPGILIDDGNSGNGTLGDLDRRNTLMNQQTQAVDLDGRVHMIMWHADDAHRDAVSGFTTAPAAYFHYFRDPTTGDWSRSELPTDRVVGSRPKIAYDSDGNVYAVYVSPGAGDGSGVLDYYADGDLIIAGATKASNYTDWSILQTDTRNFAGEPLLDEQRLLDDGVLSIFIQENDSANTGATGTPLHVLDFNTSLVLSWIGDDTGTWHADSGNDWDTNSDGIGNAIFSTGKTVRFTDTASTFNVNIPSTVTPGNMTFENTANTYTITGAGIGGSGSLSVQGGGNVTLNNTANTYTGDTNVTNGTLALQGNATIADSPNINVTGNGTLDVSALASTFTLAGGQTLNNDSNNTVVGNIDAGNGSTITGTGTFVGNVTAQNGSTLRIGGAGMPVSASVTLIDNFDAYDNSGGTTLGATPGNLTGDVWVGEWDGTGGAHITDDPDGDQSMAVREGSGWRGMETDLKNNFSQDFSLADGDTATYFYQVMAEGTDTDCMIGLAEDRASVDTTDSWRDFSVMPYVKNGNLSVYGDNIGDQAVTAMTTGDWYNVWVVVDNDTKTFDMYWSTGTNDGTLAFSDVSFGRITNPFNLEAFSAMNNGTDLVHVDNLYKMLGVDTTNPMVGGESVAYAPEVMTVDGDVALQTGSTVMFDIATDGVNDLLDISGSLTLGGTLDVVLADGVAAPTLGDSFDLFDFASASGTFATLNLPTLDAGLYWDTTHLLSTGVITVVDVLPATLPGDLNGDGYVGLDDLQPILDHWNQTVAVGDTSMGDISGPGGVPDGYVGLDDLQPVLDHWNEGTLPTPGLPGANIPEPATLFWLAAASGLVVNRKPRARH